MRVRKVTPRALDGSGGDYVFGSGGQDYWHDVPDAPAQLCASRLHLEVGQWFLDRSEGIDYRRRVLGKRTEATRDAEIRTRILGTQGVTGIASYGSVLNRDIRGFVATTTLNTAYGPAPLNEPI